MIVTDAFDVELTVNDKFTYCHRQGSSITFRKGIIVERVSEFKIIVMWTMTEKYDERFIGRTTWINPKNCVKEA